MVAVTILVPTFRRPDLLAAALRSIDDQLYSDAVTTIVIDNCRDGSARPVFDEVVRAAKRSFQYVNETTPGVSAARNRGVGMATTDLVVFLDDDQTAQPGWLQALVDAQQQLDADAVFGFTDAWTSGDAHGGKDLALALIHRDFGHPLGPVRRGDIARLGTNNSLFHRRQLRGQQTFDLRLGLTGGEDTDLIARIEHRGGKLVYAPAAHAKEFVPAERTTMKFVLERRFSSGQLRTRQQASWLATGKWMAIGAAQATVGVVGACATAVVAPSRARKFLGTAAAGLGKVLFVDAMLVERYRR
jgi:succinoglycan biosynthesis protein ExoM